VDIRNAKVDNLNLILMQLKTGQKEPNLYRVEQVAVACPRFTFTEPAELTTDARLNARVAVPGPGPDAPKKMQDFSARFNGKMAVEASGQKFKDLSGSFDISKVQGKVQEIDLSSYGVTLTPRVVLASEDVIQTSGTQLRVFSGEKTLAQADLGVEWNLKTQKGTGALKLKPLDRRVLNILAAAQGVDFRDTTVAMQARGAFEASGAVENVEVALDVKNLNATVDHLRTASLGPTRWCGSARPIPPTGRHCLSKSWMFPFGRRGRGRGAMWWWPDSRNPSVSTPRRACPRRVPLGRML
jgi:hypothetical protein